MDKQKVRLVDIAEKAGVTAATVSMALRNDPRISKATRARLQTLAEQMNYEPDAAAAALSRKHANRNVPQYLGTVALLCAESHFEGLRKSARYDKLRTLLEHTCARLGYKLDYFTVGSEKKAQRALNRMLLARGIRGLLVHGENRPIRNWALDWDHFAVTAYSISMHSHTFNNVISASYQDIYDATVRLLEMGFQKPGLFSPFPGADHFVGGFVAAASHWGIHKQLPKLAFEKTVDGDQERELFAKWFKRYQPDVVLGGYDDHLTHLFSSINVRVPEDVGYCSIDISDHFKNISGLIQPRSEAYRVMVDMLHGMLTRHEYGIPSNPLCIQIPSKWNSGKTLQPPENSVPTRH